MKQSIVPGGNDDSRCYLCWYPYSLQRHHMMHGTANRAKAEEWGLTVYLCSRCHRLLHDKGERDLELECVAQRVFEERYGHELWMKEFGKDYLSTTESEEE